MSGTSAERSSAAFEFPIERGKILEFARAMKSPNPAYRGDDAVAPPTFLIVGGQVWGYSWEEPGDSPLAAIELDPEKQLHLEEEYEFFGPPPRAGQTLIGQLTLLEPVQKVGRRSGPMTILTTVTEYRDEDGKLVARARQVIARIDEPRTLAENIDPA